LKKHPTKGEYAYVRTFTNRTDALFAVSALQRAGYYAKATVGDAKGDWDIYITGGNSCDALIFLSRLDRAVIGLVAEELQKVTP
jgi:hypothetical protein